MLTFAAPEFIVPMYTMVSGSLSALLAFSASFSAIHFAAAAVASSRASYSMMKLPALRPDSSIAIRIALTTEIDCP